MESVIHAIPSLPVQARSFLNTKSACFLLISLMLLFSIRIVI